MGLLASSLVPTVLSQHTEAVCNITSLSWTFNSLGQSPCLVAAYMLNPCSTDGDVDVPTSGPGQHYALDDGANPCQCNSVSYSLLSACASCQEGEIDSWTDYTDNCTQVYPDGQYGFAIPAGTAVPKWAYQLVTGTNRFNLSEAQITGDKPENLTTTTSSSRPSDSANSKPSSKNTTAVIAGSVVGGVIAIAILGGLLTFWLISQRRKRDAPDPAPSVSQISNHGRPVSQYTVTASPDPTKITQANTPIGPRSGYNQSVPLSMHGGGRFDRPYNPDDPSTFPPPRTPLPFATADNFSRRAP